MFLGDSGCLSCLEMAHFDFVKNDLWTGTGKCLSDRNERKKEEAEIFCLNNLT